MKEKELIEIIKSTLNSEYIGDDCAYIKDLGIVITQDSLVEDVHFSLKYTNAYQLGWKSVIVNLSDVCASGAEPKYLTIALSLPEYINENFVKNFYKGAQDAAGKVKIVGGDITGSKKLFVSVTAIGKTESRNISSRANAKIGYKIIVSGEHGNSAYGYNLLNKIALDTNIDNNEKQFFINSHLMPSAQFQFSEEIAINCVAEYAMMDTSDGLADALMQIAKASKATLSVSTSKIPKNKHVNTDTALYGGEDYQLVACVPESILTKLSKYFIIGEVKTGKSGIELDGNFLYDIDDKLFNHFEVKNEI